MTEQMQHISQELSDAEKEQVGRLLAAQHRSEVHARIRSAVLGAVTWYGKNWVNVAITSAATGLVLTTAAATFSALLPVSVLSGITLAATGLIIAPAVAGLVYAIISQIVNAVIKRLIPAIKESMSNRVLKNISVDQAKKLGVKIGEKLKEAASEIQSDIAQELATTHATA